MADMSLTVFDMAVLFVVGVSALLALARGLVRESLSIVVWVLAALVAYAAFPPARALVGDYIPNVWIADAAALSLVFVLPLVCLKIVAMVVADSMPRGRFGPIDHALGAGYGFVRGAVVISLAYLGLSLINQPENHPAWIRHAQLLPYVQDGAELLAGWVPEDILSAGAWQDLPEVPAGSLGSSPAAAEPLAGDRERPPAAAIPETAPAGAD